MSAYSWIFRTLAAFTLGSLMFAVLPGGLFAAMHRFGAISWKVPAHGRVPEKGMSSIRLMLTSWVGGFVGVTFAFISMNLAAQWDVLMYPSLARDGQGGLVIIFTAPVCGLLAAVLAVLGYRLFLCSSSLRLWSAPWLYSGSKKVANIAIVSAVFLVLSGCFFFCSFLLNWMLMHPGPS